MKKYIFGLLLILAAWNETSAQTITNGDGSALTTQYCWNDVSYAIAGQPTGGTFTGCGISQQNGNWYFNPVTATAGLTVFPFQCNITYTINGSSVTRNVLIWKPVVITPPLKDSFTCNGQIHLEAHTLYAGAYTYLWTPAAPLNNANSNIADGQIAQTTTFIITATDNTSGCMGRDTVTITKYPVPHATIRDDTTILARQEVQLWATGGIRYQWFPERWMNNDTIANPIAAPREPLVYSVSVANEYGCTDTASVSIHIIEDIFVPNAFSPNGDGINDIFKIENFGYQGIESFYVFNRFGQAVYQNFNNKTQGWDGTFKGQPAEVGSYYYLIKLAIRNGGTQTFKGDLTLIR